MTDTADTGIPEMPTEAAPVPPAPVRDSDIPYQDFNRAQAEKQAAQQEQSQEDIQAMVREIMAREQEQKVAEQPKPQEKTDMPEDRPGWIPEDLNEFDVSSIEDPTIRAIGRSLRMMAPDLDYNRAIGDALSTGNPKLLNTVYIREIMGDNATDVIELAKDAIQAVHTVSDNITNEVVQMVGGDAAYNTIASVFAKVASPADQEYVDSRITSRDRSKIIDAITHMANIANKSGKIPVPGQNLVGKTAGEPALEGLSMKAFQKALNTIRGTVKDPAEFAQQEKVLIRQRELGRQNGL